MMTKTHIANVERTAESTCCGCGLCVNACPKDAIRMEWNSQGFLEPHVDESLCIECGLCVRKCPVLEPVTAPELPKNPETIKAYGAWHKLDETRKMSSSGGVFSALASVTLKKGGCVFGVVWKDKQTAGFAKAETAKELLPMLGSKYTQAEPANVYREVAHELASGREVLFTGTPCQVAALKSFLRKPYENLLTIEAACHGVPTRNALTLYTDYLEKCYGRTLEKISFREKDHGWAYYTVANYFSDGSREARPLNQDLYMQIFLSDAVLNQACYGCRFARIPRAADITVADFWGVEAHYPDWPSYLGINAILANTKKAESVLAEASDELELRSVPFSVLLSTQKKVYVRETPPENPKRPYVEKAIRKGDFVEAAHQGHDYRYVKGIKIRMNSLWYRLLKSIYRKLIKK